jgi:hypothetical protein
VSKLSTLSITGGGALDLTDNKLIITTLNSIGPITSLIAAGRNGGQWNGANGILTSAASPGNNFTSIGVATAAQVKNIAENAASVWAGQSVNGTDTLVMYTYGGDANLDGKITISDYGRIDFNIGIPNASGWFNGDFNYDGRVDISDYGIIDFNVGIQGAPFYAGAGDAAPVPEPAFVPFAAAVGALAWTAQRARGNRSNAS